MKTTKLITCLRSTLRIAAGIFLALAGPSNSLAYDDYAGCQACHGDFLGTTSTKGTVFPGNNHDMHRGSANMGTACALCHGASLTPVRIGASTGTANNPGLGCVGCHLGPGLRARHAANGVSECGDCHDPETPAPENVKPPYYGTVDTKANNPGNEVRASGTNENWSVGDFLGLDNDGNNLYDVADYAIGPFRLLSVDPEGVNLRVTWLTAGGRTNLVQAANALPGAFANISSPLAIPGVGLVTNSFVDVGGATNLTRFYRMAGRQ